MTGENDLAPEVKDTIQEEMPKDCELLTAEALVAGSDVEHKVYIEELKGFIVVKPITLKNVQKATQAGKGDDTETSRCIIRQAVVKPSLNDEYLDKLPIGLVNKISNKINIISGITKEMIEKVKKN